MAEPIVYPRPPYGRSILTYPPLECDAKLVEPMLAMGQKFEEVGLGRGAIGRFFEQVRRAVMVGGYKDIQGRPAPSTTATVGDTLYIHPDYLALFYKSPLQFYLKLCGIMEEQQTRLGNPWMRKQTSGGESDEKFFARVRERLTEGYKAPEFAPPPPAYTPGSKGEWQGDLQPQDRKKKEEEFYGGSVQALWERAKPGLPGLKLEAFEEAASAYSKLVADGAGNEGRLLILDLAQPSNQNRFYALNPKTGEILQPPSKAAHGAGNGNGPKAMMVSNEPNSMATPGGALLVGEEHTGPMGGRRLYGTDEKNGNTYDRYILLTYPQAGQSGQPRVPARNEKGPCEASDGCVVLNEQDFKALEPQLGDVLYIYMPPAGAQLGRMGKRP
ncbi:MAG: murein L,D-transpeptidase catalytic domain family protein [Candidatus Marsarchaeota archaeon]|nr:murein L,D-transpeptidase catalytic domain family protein [Candidatus Marsarchaeota archaeon]